MGYGKYGHAPDFARMDHEQLESYAMVCQYEVTHERCENAKLRDLVVDIWHLVKPNPGCRYTAVLERIEELGIEV